MSPAPDQAPSLVLIDGSSYLYRAFHAMPGLSAPDGQPTGALRGFVNMIERIVQEWPQARVVMVLDASARSFRNQLYAEYKAQRKPMPEDLRSQVPLIREYVALTGLPLLAIEDVEADDVIATLARREERDGGAVLLASSDKDLAQLVSAHIWMYDATGSSYTKPEDVLSSFGVAPEAMTQYQALVGDSVDNVPGVAGIGKDTAGKLLAEHGSLEAVVAAAASGGIKGKRGEAIRLSAESGELELWRNLVTLRTDLEIAPELLRPREADAEGLAAFMARMGFREGRKKAQAIDWKLEFARDEAAFGAWLDAHPAKGKEAALLLWPGDAAQAHGTLAWVVAAVGGSACCLAAREMGGATLDKLAALLQDAEHAYLPAAQESFCMLGEPGREKLRGQPWDDPLLQSYVQNATGSRHDVAALARRTGLPDNTEEILGKGAKRRRLGELDDESARALIEARLNLVVQAGRQLHGQLDERPALRRLYDELERPLVAVLAAMETAGVLLDPKLLQAQSLELGKSLDGLRERVWQLAGGEFNLDSPKQLGEVLFERLGLTPLRKTAGKQPSTAEPVLQEYAARGEEVPRLVLEYRGLHKLKSTYTDALVRLINPGTGRVHTRWRQRIVATGRLSSTDPNLQNIPVRTAEGRRIRQAFVAPPGQRLLVADYAQIELRVMAHLSGEPSLREAFARGEDIHASTALELFGPSGDADQAAEHRRAAKAINFGLLYGMSAFGLANQLGVSQEQAQDYMKLYFERYPVVRAYIDDLRERARKEGAVETLLGRRLELRDIRSGNYQLRAAAERAAINAPMQGTAADIIKTAMLRLDAWLRKTGAAARMVMQVHDELVLEVAEDQVDSVREGVRDAMENALALEVPLVVSFGVGKDWDEAAHGH